MSIGVKILECPIGFTQLRQDVRKVSLCAFSMSNAMCLLHL